MRGSTLLAVFVLLIPVAFVCAELTTSDLILLTRGADGSASDSESSEPDISPNGRYAVFVSSATNLIDAPGSAFSTSKQVYQFDLKTEEVKLISKNGDTNPGNSDSTQPAVSAVGPDGIYGIAFTSRASNLESDTSTGGYKNVFVHVSKYNRTNSLTSNMDIGSPDGDSEDPTIAYVPEKRKMTIAFASASTKINPGDTNTFKDVFFNSCVLNSAKPECDLKQGGIVSKGVGDVPADGDSYSPRISGDGRFIVFVSKARNMISGGVSSAFTQVYRFEIETGKIELISKSDKEVEGDGDSSSPAISFSGQFVVFQSEAPNITGSSPGRSRIVLIDLSKNIKTIVDEPLSVATTSGDSRNPRISPDGRLISFESTIPNLIEEDTDTKSDVYLYDSEFLTLSRVSQNSLGVQGDNDSSQAAIALDGFASKKLIVLFSSLASNLTTDVVGSSVKNVFSAKIEATAPILRPDTVLEIPADVIVKPELLKVNMQPFSGVIDSVSIADSRGISAARSGVMYDVRVSSKKRGGDRIRKTTNKNRATFRNVKPGTYYVKYRVSSQSNGNSSQSTGFSPRQTVRVR